jgi:hypothetical protein
LSSRWAGYQRVSGIDEIQRASPGQARLIVRVLGAISTRPSTTSAKKYPPFAPFRRRCFRPSSRRSIPTRLSLMVSKTMSLRTLTELADKQIARGIRRSA